MNYILDRNFNNILYTIGIMGNGDFPHTAQGIEKAADAIVTIWSNIARSSFKHSSGEYIHGIQKGKIYPFQGDKYHAAVINTARSASIVEEGIKPFSLRNMLYTSQKVRVNKNGKRYLVIPFRHRVSAMPKSVVQEAQNLSISRITGTRMEGVQQGANSYKQAMIMKANNPRKVKRLGYQWGSRLNDKVVNDDGKLHSTIYDGLVKFPRENSGTSGSKYMTFRVISEETSGGWQHPGVEAKHIAQRTIKASEFTVNRIIDQAFLMDKRLFEEMFS